MAIVLTCDCGARFEVEDLLAGQDVSCPECQQSLAVPARPTPPRTSDLALASVVLCLMGAFTILGTLAATVLGILALVQINRQRERLTGSGFALFGIIGGLAFTAATVFALTRGELFGVDSWMRRQSLSNQVDTSGPLDLHTSDRHLSLRRPSEKWGRVTTGQTDDPAVGDLQVNLDLLLVEIKRNAFVDVTIDRNNGNADLNNVAQEMIRTLGTQPNPFGGDEDAPRGGPGRPGRYLPPRVIEDRLLDPSDGHDVQELVCEARRGGQRWWFLIRFYRRQGKPDDPIYIVRAYTPARRVGMNEPELRRIIDSVRLGK